MADSDQSVAVVICTRNRCESLRRALESLVGCDVPNGARFKVCVIDNASTDSTRAVVEEFREPLAPIYFREEAVGLSNARNRALRELERFELILFTDDDVRVDPRWLTGFLDAARCHPAASYFGGKVLPSFPGGKPSWLKDEGLDLIDGLFVRYDPGGATRPIAGTEILPIGASMGFRRNRLGPTDLFDTELGVSGKRLDRGEDTEFLSRLRARGEVGVYVADAVAFHAVDPKRMKWSYAFRYGVAVDGGKGSFLLALGYCLRGLRQWAIGRGDRARQCLIRAGMEIRARTRAVDGRKEVSNA